MFFGLNDDREACNPWNLEMVLYFGASSCFKIRYSRLQNLCNGDHQIFQSSSYLESIIFGLTPAIAWYMGVSKNRGTPKSSILTGFSTINHPFWWIFPYFWFNTHIYLLHISYTLHGRFKDSPTMTLICIHVSIISSALPGLILLVTSRPRWPLQEKHISRCCRF